MLIVHLFDRKNLATKTSELGQFLLNCLQPLLPLTMRDLCLSVGLVSKTKLFV